MNNCETWQPIETAPKDGTAVLTYNPSFYQGAGGVIVGCCLRGEWLAHFTRINPTHWMSLPAPPHHKPLASKEQES